MGTLVIRIPEDINEEYEVGNSEIAEKLLEILKSAAKLKEKSESWLGIFKDKSSRKEKVLLGASEDDAEVTDQVGEAMQARESNPLSDNLFGIWKDNYATEDVDQYVRNLRQGRQSHAH